MVLHIHIVRALRALPALNASSMPPRQTSSLPRAQAPMSAPAPWAPVPARPQQAQALDPQSLTLPSHRLCLTRPTHGPTLQPNLSQSQGKCPGMGLGLPSCPPAAQILVGQCNGPWLPKRVLTNPTGSPHGPQSQRNFPAFAVPWDV